MSTSCLETFVDRFLKRASHTFSSVLFDELPDVQFYMKDLQGRYVQVNQVVKENYLMSDDREIIRKTDHQLFPRYLADHYVQDDQQVLQGATIRNRIELVGRYDGTTAWSRTTKTPVRSRNGRIIGLAGMTRDLGKMSATVLPYQELSAATRYIDLHHGEVISVAVLARIAHVSPRALQRKFQKVFRMSPLQYVRRVRISKASRLLASSQKSIKAIAACTGFSDQSHLTREFVRCVGATPRAYRMRYLAENQESKVSSSKMRKS